MMQIYKLLNAAVTTIIEYINIGLKFFSPTNAPFY